MIQYQHHEENLKKTKLKNGLYSSLDEFYYKVIDDNIFFQFTKIPCSYYKIDGFKENNIFHIDVPKIPIYRMFETNPDDLSLIGTDYYFIPFEDNLKTIVWKGYHRPDFSELILQYKLNECPFYELFLNGGFNIDILLEYSLLNEYIMTLFKENEDPIKDNLYIWYSNNYNIDCTNIIDDLHIEHIINFLQPFTKELIKECIQNNDFIQYNFYYKNLNDKALIHELLGENKYMPHDKKRFLFKIHDYNLTSSIKIDLI